METASAIAGIENSIALYSRHLCIHSVVFAILLVLLSAMINDICSSCKQPSIMIHFLIFRCFLHYYCESLGRITSTFPNNAKFDLRAKCFRRCAMRVCASLLHTQSQSLRLHMFVDLNSLYFFELLLNARGVNADANLSKKKTKTKCE